MRAVCLLSGGLDSCVAFAVARSEGYECHALSFDYGQRHRVELESASRIARQLGAVEHRIVQFDLRQFGGSALTSDIAVPKDQLGPGIPVTYVPARNLIFLALTLGWAEPLGAHDIFIGVNALDYSGYPDCRPEFITSFAETARLATKDGVEGKPFAIHTPLQHWGKARIAAEVHRLGLDPAMSWSCYDPTPEGLACGLCDSCRLRRAGFAEAGLDDGTAYAA